MISVPDIISKVNTRTPLSFLELTALISTITFFPVDGNDGLDGASDAAVVGYLDDADGGTGITVVIDTDRVEVFIGTDGKNWLFTLASTLVN